MAPLEFDQIVSGTFSLICVIVSLIIGLTITLKYLKYKQKALIYVGYTTLGIFTPWWPSSISFIISFFNDGAGLVPYPLVYFFILGFLSASISIACIIAMVDLLEVKEKNKKPIILIVAIINIAIEIAYLALAFVAPHLIGFLDGPLTVTFATFGKIWAANLILLFLSTFILFSLKSMKSNSPEVRLKGRFVLVGSLSFAIGAVLDSLIELRITFLVIVRTVLIISVILLYCGFLLPKYVKKIFLK